MPDVVAPDELLARYIVSSRWVRKTDQTVKPDAYIPDDSLELSVTRHLKLSENEIWRIGKTIAANIPRNLHGRADVKTSYVTAQNLEVVAQPLPGVNPNHANITNWPSNKEDRKMCALEIARAANFIANPDVTIELP